MNIKPVHKKVLIIGAYAGGSIVVSAYTVTILQDTVWKKKSSKFHTWADIIISSVIIGSAIAIGINHAKKITKESEKTN